MSGGAIVFMLVSWAFVLGLTFWSFARILSTKRHFDPDGIGPGGPPVPPAAPRGPPPRDP
jgi:hypothetical protein